MRTVFSVLLTYILAYVFGVIAGAALVTLFFACTNFIAGLPLRLFTLNDFLYGIYVTVPIITLFLPMFLYFSTVRNSRKNKIIAAITIWAAAVPVWIFAMPLFFNYTSTKINPAAPQKPNLSSGYFRKSGDTVYYFTNIHENGNADGLAFPEIIVNQNNSHSFEILNNKKILMPEADYFSDILVKQTVDVPRIVSASITDFTILEEAAFNSYKKGFKNFLVFSLLSIALLSAGALTSLSSWRLINVFCVFLANAVILKINAVCLGQAVYGQPFNFIYNFNNTLVSKGYSFGLTDFPLVAIVNICCIAILFLTGIFGKILFHTKDLEED